MTVDGRTFDRHIETWIEEQEQPWMALRYNLEQAHIRRHVQGGKLRVLDAGGGNGRHALRLARQGHQVVVVDYSAEMLADGRRQAEEQGLADQVTFLQANVSAIPALFPEPTFDLVLCHNVLQYAEDPAAMVRAVSRPLREKGWISLVTVNSHAEVYKAVFRELDLERAQGLLEGQETVATLFEVPVKRFTDDELAEYLLAAGCQTAGRYGVRCLCDWLPNEPKSDPAFMARLERLELQMAERFPFYLLGRFFQVIGRKDQSK